MIKAKVKALGGRQYFMLIIKKSIGFKKSSDEKYNPPPPI
jgi:hypothetical protein